MPLSMPMWPAVSMRRRWMIVDDTVRREVTQAEYRAALQSSSRVEVAHFPHEDVLTHFCYRVRSWA
jgi:hypothetical protein